ncbi:MAG: hypothetical protein KJ593_07385 [Candidatus Omnitrophica bacterium]|nr:hypothetical protein [Candidatus Omnitrophota bacterium]
MAAPKLKIVFYENENVQSYFYLEKTESLRVIKILKILPQLTEWTPVSTISKKISAKLPATLWTIQKLAGAQRIEINTGKETQTIAERPIILVQKKQYNTLNNILKTKYLRATVYVKAHIRK